MSFSVGTQLLKGARAAGGAVAGAARRVGNPQGAGRFGWDLTLGMTPRELGTTTGVIAAPGIGAWVGDYIPHEYREGKERAERQNTMYDRAIRAARRQRVMGAKQKAIELDVARSLAKLAAADPHLYQEVLYGRRLPQGARVFGGSPNVDVLKQLGYDMATGAVGEPDPMDELAELVGVT